MTLASTGFSGFRPDATTSERLFRIRPTPALCILNPDGDNGASVLVTRQIARAVLNRAIGSGAGDDQRHVITFYPGNNQIRIAQRSSIFAAAVKPPTSISMHRFSECTA